VTVFSDKNYPKFAHLITPSKRVGFQLKISSKVKVTTFKRAMTSSQVDIEGVIDQND
jgi:hypothetical protein